MMANVSTRPVVLGVVVLVLLAGCGADDATSETTPVSPPSASPASPSTSGSGSSLPSAGDWETSYGPLRFTVTDQEFSGTYDGENTIAGTVDGAQVAGEWFESLNSVACEEERGGTAHWGTFTFAFSADGNTFEGTWGYCDGAQESAWSGERAPDAELS